MGVSSRFENLEALRFVELFDSGKFPIYAKEFGIYCGEYIVYACVSLL